MVTDFLQDVTPADVLVVSDFDGTLAPIVSRPEQAAARPEAVTALEGLVAAGARVAVISGRSRMQLQKVLPLPGVRLLGDYGLEEPSDRDLQALSEFNEAVAPRVRSLRGVVLEAKPGSTSVHFRDNPAAGAPLLDELRPLAARLGLRAGGGRMVVEVRPEGADKGRALGRLLSTERPAAVAFAGDDEGDRGAFEVAARHPRHLVVGVRSPEAPADLFDACDVVVDRPEGWIEILTHLAGSLRKPRA